MSSYKKIIAGYATWYKDAECTILHRVDGPAISRKNYDEWRYNGVLHRVGGPALIYKDGDQAWFVNGVRHRLDGPAIKEGRFHQEWWVFGKNIKKRHLHSFLALARNSLGSTPISKMPYDVLEELFMAWYKDTNRL